MWEIILEIRKEGYSPAGIYAIRKNGASSSS
jgi:hypothetical protein